jgi:hypothetical protein
MTSIRQDDPSGQAAPQQDAEKCPPLDVQVRQLAESAAQGEFDKSAKDKLAEIAKGADAALEKYKDPTNGRAALVALWQKQDETVQKIRQHLQSCYPCWKQILCCRVCKPVIEPIGTTWKDLREKLGPCQRELEDARYCFDQAAAQLEAWKDISGWLKKRLDENQALIDEICKLDKCEDHAFALYIFYFELLRQHSRLMPGQNSPEDRYDPIRHYCKVELEPCCKLVGFPWLIEAEQYHDKLSEAACRWRDAGKEKAGAEAAVAWIEELRKRLAEDGKPENKRVKAKQYLKDLKPGKGECKDGGNGGGEEPEPCPEPEPEPDPCPPKPEPCPEPEPCPKPDPYPKPDPKPDPCPDPDPKPDPMPGA